jgi:hypothetical protein
MAVAGYGYNPKDVRSGIVTEIQGDLERNGIRLDSDTVRKWLRAAVEEVGDLLSESDVA